MADNYLPTIELEFPIHFGNDEITELKIKRPNARTVIRFGNPVKVKSFDPLDIEFDSEKAFAIISNLCNLPVLGTLEDMSSNDAVTCMYSIAPFFIPGYRTTAVDKSEDTQSKPQEQSAS